MNHGRIVTKAIPLLFGIGLLLSACAAESEHGAQAYTDKYPVYGSLNFDYDDWGGWRGWHHGWGHGFEGHSGGSRR